MPHRQNVPQSDESVILPIAFHGRALCPNPLAAHAAPAFPAFPGTYKVQHPRSPARCTGPAAGVAGDGRPDASQDGPDLPPGPVDARGRMGRQEGLAEVFQDSLVNFVDGGILGQRLPVL